MYHETIWVKQASLIFLCFKKNNILANAMYFDLEKVQIFGGIQFPKGLLNRLTFSHNRLFAKKRLV